MATKPGPESGHDQIQHLPRSAVRPAPENDGLYRPVDPTDPAMAAFVASVKQFGVQDPLIVSADGFLVSGHRRYAAAEAVGLETLPCLVRHDISRAKNPALFLRLLRECNRQRHKSFDEILRESVLDANPDQAFLALQEHRQQQAKLKVHVKTLELGDLRARAAISKAKGPFLAAIKAIVEERRAFWPLSDRQIHYALLNDPPLIHAAKPGSTYRNDLRSYKSLVELVTRARLTGEISSDAIADETRPVSLWDVHANVATYLDTQMLDLLLTYRRDLQVSQPNHIELVVEKNTVLPIIEPLAREYCLPLTSGRGYCSLPPREAMAERFFASGKEKLVLLTLTDFDPDGETIASSLARSLRDDFFVVNIAAIKVALTASQVKQFRLPPGMKAKAGSATRKAFVEQHGELVFELEALRPEDLQQITREAIENVLDMAAFRGEIEQEKADAANLMARRRIVLKALGK